FRREVTLMCKLIDRQSLSILALTILIQSVQVVSSAYADSARLILNYTNGQPILDYVYQTPTDTISAGVRRDNGVPYGVEVQLDAFGTNLLLRNTLDLDTSQLMTPIQPGTYLNAQRWPFA